MTCVSCSVSERFVNPLFEVFDGGDFILSSYRDIEEDFTRMRIYVERAEEADGAQTALQAALDVVGVAAAIERTEIPDEDWKFAYRRHFKTELVSPRILVQPEWEEVAVIRFDPGMAFGTGKHETTKACLQYIDEILSGPDGKDVRSFLDMGCGSGILSIAAAKLGCTDVLGFDVDPEAVDASIENASKNGVNCRFAKFALGRTAVAGAAAGPEGPVRAYDLVAANILGPLLIRFADEIVPYVGRRLIVSGILNELYPEVRAAFAARGLKEVSSRTLGEWTTGLLLK